MPAEIPQNRIYPIIYVRGYAMTKGEQDETSADPFCGFNLGATVYRATADKNKPARKFIFESPVVRLMSPPFGYKHVCEEGLDVMDKSFSGKSIPRQSIVIYRYYDQASSLLGNSKTPEIEEFAKGLSDLILKVRGLVCADGANGLNEESFRCYLVAHSMGGLVCRAFLQNPALGDPMARGCVDKFFTYATPHNGIEMAGINVPGFFEALGKADTFNRERMAGYLNLSKKFKDTGRVDWWGNTPLPPERVFCMIGTNRADYEVAMGLSRTFAGHGSDGLVRIDNASLGYRDAEGNDMPCATAYTFRSHSGYFGIVNGEESFQNLTRFLFGDFRVEIWFDVEEVRLPADLDGHDVDATYQFELIASPLGKPWSLTRRIAVEDSVACRSHKELTDPETSQRRNICLSTVFLARHGMVEQDGNTLSYAIALGVCMPDYETDGHLWLKNHYEGSSLLRRELEMKITLPQEGNGWSITGHWRVPDSSALLIDQTKDNEKITLKIPIDNNARPGIRGQLRLVVSQWNE